MAHLEHLISRYLDADLTAGEREEIDRLLAESPEARAHLRETMAIARAARRMPLLDRPNEGLEQRLFQRLQAEGLHAPGAEVPTPVVVPPSALGRGWYSMLAGVIAVLLLLIGIGGMMRQSGTLADDVRVYRDVAANGSGHSAAIDPANPGTAVPNQSNVQRTAPASPVVADANAPHVAASSVAPSSAIPELSHIASPVSSPRIASSHPASSSRARRNAASLHGASPNAPSSRDAAANLGPSRTAPVVNGKAARVEGVPNAAATVPNGVPPTNEVPAVNDVPAANGASGNPTSIAANVVPSTIDPAVLLRSQSTVNDQPAPMPSGSARWSASLRGGVATMGGVDAVTARELDVKVGLRVGSSHQISLVVAMGPTASQVSLENTGKTIGTSSIARDSYARTHESVVASAAGVDQSVKSEAWIGVGYNYSLPLGGALSLEPGARIGTGASAWRIGAELPLRFRMSPTMSLECAGSLARVMPFGMASDRTRADLADSYVYYESTQPLAVTTYGVQLGMRIDFGAGR